MEQLSEASREALSIFEKNNVPLLPMSAVTDEGVMDVKQQVFFSFINFCLLMYYIIFHIYLQACDTLLAYRIENKIQAKKVDSILNRLHVALPKARDEVKRPPHIPGIFVELIF